MKVRNKGKNGSGGGSKEDVRVEEEARIKSR
jgi:hypothetical protein